MTYTKVDKLKEIADLIIKKTIQAFLQRLSYISANCIRISCLPAYLGAF